MGKPGSELVRSILWLPHPPAAMDRCYEIYKNSEDIEAQRTAVELLRVVADKRTLKWIREFLEDEDQSIQLWGAGVVDQLIWSELVEAEECIELFEIMKNHDNEQVREKHKWIIDTVNERNG